MDYKGEFIIASDTWMNWTAHADLKSHIDESWDKVWDTGAGPRYFGTGFDIYRRKAVSNQSEVL